MRRVLQFYTTYRERELATDETFRTVKSKSGINLQARILANPQAAHPHVCEQHLAASVCDEVALFRSHS